MEDKKDKKLGPGLFEFLESGDEIPYNPGEFSYYDEDDDLKTKVRKRLLGKKQYKIDMIVNAIQEIWYDRITTETWTTDEKKSGTSK